MKDKKNLNNSEVECALYPSWIDAKKQNPPYSKHGENYLVILTNRARSNHAKNFAGCGKPEIANWCNNYEGSYKWNCRGSLVVAYWMPLPKFDKKYILGLEGEEPQWV